MIGEFLQVWAIAAGVALFASACGVLGFIVGTIVDDDKADVEIAASLVYLRPLRTGDIFRIEVPLDPEFKRVMRDALARGGMTA